MCSFYPWFSAFALFASFCSCGAKNLSLPDPRGLSHSAVISPFHHSSTGLLPDATMPVLQTRSFRLEKYLILWAHMHVSHLNAEFNRAACFDLVPSFYSVSLSYYRYKT